MIHLLLSWTLAAQPLQDPSGLWRSDDGSKLVRIRCADGICQGTNAKAAGREDSAKALLKDLRRSSSGWAGVLRIPKLGKETPVEVRACGSDTLLMKATVFFVTRTRVWIRQR